MVCLMLLGTFFSILPLQESVFEKLDGYKFPVYSTQFCPRNATEWKTMSKVLNCTEENGYTCLPNEEITGLLQFCYTDPHILIEEGLCLYLIKSKSLVHGYRCHEFRFGCPSSSYLSTEIYNYPSCIHVENGCFFADQRCKSNRTIAANDKKTTKNERVLLFVLIPSSIIFSGVSTALFIICKRKIQTCRQKKDEIEIGKHKEEKDPFIVENTPTISEKEIQTWRQKKDEIEIGKHKEEKDTLIVENIPMISERVIQTWRQKKDEIEIGKRREEKDTLIVENKSMISEREIRSQGILKEKSVQMSSTDELQYIKSKSTRYAVAAMDLGTAFSGCAYSQNKKWHIVNVHHWSTGCFISNKVSTAMLLNPDQTFRAFGYDAEQIYSSLVEIDMNDDGKIITKDNSNDYYFFQRFTVLQNLDSKSYIEDITGKKMKAITIFSMLINYFKNELIETMNRSIAIGTISESDVFFVLTVPANCGERAKHFIRKAAKTAEIKANQLSIVFEEEAVASYCQHMHLDNYDATIDNLLKKEKKCMVVDLGADSVKVAVLEFAADGTLKKLYPPTRENCGGISVDEEFEKFMENIGGEGIMKSFAKDHIEDFLMMQREFETKKRESSNKAIKIRIPESFHKTLKKRYKGGMEAALHLSPYRDIVSFFSFKLILPPEVFKTFFNKTIQNVSNLITQNPQKGGVKSIIMVGGLAGSEIIRDSLRERFSDTYVIVTPPEAELAVLKGAVYLGHIPSSKSSQVQCLTYT